jgi:hypothetical protein
METETEKFLAELVQLCGKHGATILPRRHGVEPLITVQVGDTPAADFRQIDGTLAEPLPPNHPKLYSS